VTGVPGDAKTWFMGAASGGIWKSVDSGATFKPVFDKEPVQAIGALAVSQSNHAIVWAGTGEAWAIRDADVFGDGVYKSTDSGATWTNMGLTETGRIGRIIINPANPDNVFVCALGRATGPQQERGVYRTLDGGKTWKRVLFVDENTGCSGLTMDAHNHNVLFAGMWQVVMHTWGEFSGGPSSGIYVSRDGGTTWSHVQDAGLPKSPVGKIDVAVAPTNPKRVYALIQTANQGSIWRSDDGGHTWKHGSWSRQLIGRAGYYIRLAVSSGNADEVLVANSSFFQSKDGGMTFTEVPWGGDNHDIWIDPVAPDRFAMTNDLGANITFNHGRSRVNVVLPIAQAYHVAVDNQVPYWVYTNRQDNSTMRGPSDAPDAAPFTGRRGGGPPPAARRPATARDSARADSLRRRGDSSGARPPRRDSVTVDTTNLVSQGLFQGSSNWEHNLGGCESGFTVPDPEDSNIVWATCYGDVVTRYDARTKRARSVSPWMHTLDMAPEDAKYRCHWTPPLAIDPFDHNTVYYGCQVIFKTTNAGQSWSVISPDLSTRDPSRVVSSGGLVGDNLGQFYGEVVFAIAPSEIQKGLLWAGTNDGKVWYTPDGGATWNDVSANMQAPAWGTVRKIEPSHFDPATAYVAVDYHMMDDRRPYIYKTTDFGKTWTNITGDLPTGHPLDYVMAVTENPNRKGMLFAGTGHGFFYSMNDGAHWTRFSEGLPAAPVDWIVVPKRWHDVVVSTYGRGIYLLKDITPLEMQGTTAELAGSPTANGGSASAAVRLYPPHLGYRQARSGHADITFSLARASRQPVELQILDSAGTVVRTMRTLTRAGYNRVAWDLHYDAPKAVELVTTPVDNPHIWDEPRFKGKKFRPITHWGIEGTQRTGPLAPPGKYTVKLIAGGVTTQQPLEIIKDPEITASEADLVANSAAQIQVRNDLDTTAALVNRLELMRKQVQDARAAKTTTADQASALDALDAKMLDVELQLLTKGDLNSDDKYFTEAPHVYLDLIWLYGEIGGGAGDVAGGPEFRPTDASMQTLATIEQKLAAAQQGFATLMSETIPAFNREMSGKLPAIAPSVIPQ
jgi:photosystem II stability/assembly factor-like uncharacterized protein